jgi:hypothetical protein
MSMRNKRNRSYLTDNKIFGSHSISYFVTSCSGLQSINSSASKYLFWTRSGYIKHGKSNSGLLKQYRSVSWSE